MQSDGLNNSEQNSSNKKNLFPFLVYFFSYLLFLIPITPAIISYTIVYISASLLFIVISFYILRSDISIKYIYVFTAVSIIIRTAVIFIAPAGSDDYYRYIWDGKVLANGINPYQYAPSNIELQQLHSEALPSLVKFPDLKTVYPPLSEIFFYLAYLLGAESFYGIKILLLLFELLAIFIILQVLKKLRLPIKNILFYALCPLPIFQFFIDAHVDGFGISLLLLFILFYTGEKYLLSYFFLGLSICVKPVGLLIIPLIFFHQKGLIKKIIPLLIPIGLCALLYLFFSLYANPFEALTNFTVNWTFNGFFFNITDSFIKDNQKSRLICAAIFVISFIPVILSRKEFLIKIYYAVFILLIFSPIVHPWYISWLAILLPFTARLSGVFYAGLVSLTAATILKYQMYGEWNDNPVVWFLEYIPVLFFFIYELFSGNKIINKDKTEKQQVLLN
jgi:hypothetical protein